MNAAGSYRGGGKSGKTKSDDGGQRYDGHAVESADLLTLGEGPISYERAMQLVEEGRAERWLEDGKWRFRRTAEPLDLPSPGDWLRSRL